MLLLTSGVHRRLRGAIVSHLFRRVTSVSGYSSYSKVIPSYEIWPYWREGFLFAAPSEVKIVMRVTDVNDNPPRFPGRGRPVVAAIPSSAPYGYQIVRLQVIAFSSWKNDHSIRKRDVNWKKNVSSRLRTQTMGSTRKFVTRCWIGPLMTNPINSL